MTRNRNDIILFLQTHREELARRFRVSAIRSYVEGNAP
jgi:hypothetical protein